VFHADKRVHLGDDAIVAEVGALERQNGDRDDPTYPLRLIAMRELRSHNSWMHNVPKLMAADRIHAARVHPDDARAHAIEDGAISRIVSAAGAIELPMKVTDEVMPGVVAVPHGWGHRGGGWRTADRAGGANVNLLASSAPAELERLAGMAFLNGIRVRLEAVPAP
jgi:anaerobic selenocysteine-containing dehydrogenase